MWDRVRPPVPLNRAERATLGLLAAVAATAGYMGSLIAATMTFAADQFGADSRAQGWALAVIRADVLIALPLAAFADRAGRRRLLLVTAAIAPVGTALCGLAPNLASLAGMQVVTRGFVTATAAVVGIILAEEMPAGARAHAASALVAAAALGSAVTLVLLPLADRSPAGWRFLYGVPLVPLVGWPVLRRRLRETRRFEAVTQADLDASPGTVGEPTSPERVRWALGPAYRRRLAILGIGYALLAAFTNPSRQFNNDFLRKERGFSAGRVSLFNLTTNAPGTVGLLIGGSLADRFGRRRMLAIGVIGGVLANVATLQSRGWALWFWALVGAAMASVALPVLAVYGSELFPTRLRGRASGLTTAFSRVGAAAGLILVGQLGRNHHLGRAISWTAVLPIIGVLVIAARSPETAGRELEELNPESSAQGRASSHSTTAAATTPSRLRNE